MRKISLGEQLAEIDRELTMRSRVYPGLVTRRKMRQSEADYQIACMEAIRETVSWAFRNQDKMISKKEE